MSIYHDGEYRESDADIEVAFPILGRISKETSTGSDHIKISTLSGGTVSFANLQRTIHGNP